MSQRDAIFISHATPEDNAFTLWLGSKLVAMGYEVFADILRLKGGDDWERILEGAIRERAAKFLLVGSPVSVEKQGVRNELTLAVATAKKIQSENFVIPLRLASFEPPLQIAHAQYIDFADRWVEGFAELLGALQAADIPKKLDAQKISDWQHLQTDIGREVVDKPEGLISNWLAIDDLPQEITFFDFKSGISLGKAQTAIKQCRIPLASHNRGFISFAPFNTLQDYFGADLPIEAAERISTEIFLGDGWHALKLKQRDTRAKFTDIARQALDSFFEARQLESYDNASGTKTWWPTLAAATKEQHSFAWEDGPQGRRQLVGRSEKRGFYWHFGVSCWARWRPIPHVRIGGRVVFTYNGFEPIGDPKRAHKMRRTFCKGWRNDKWRDLTLAFWHWLSKGAAFVDIPLGEGVACRVRLPPLTFMSPVSVRLPPELDAEISDDEDDVDLEPDDVAEGDADDDV